MTKTEKNGGRTKAGSSVGFVVSLVLFALAVLVFILVAKAKSENRPASFFRLLLFRGCKPFYGA